MLHLLYSLPRPDPVISRLNIVAIAKVTALFGRARAEDLIDGLGAVSGVVGYEVQYQGPGRGRVVCCVCVSISSILSSTLLGWW